MDRRTSPAPRTPSAASKRLSSCFAIVYESCTGAAPELRKLRADPGQHTGFLQPEAAAEASVFGGIQLSPRHAILRPLKQISSFQCAVLHRVQLAKVAAMRPTKMPPSESGGLILLLNFKSREAIRVKPAKFSPNRSTGWHRYRSGHDVPVGRVVSSHVLFNGHGDHPLFAIVLKNSIHTGGVAYGLKCHKSSHAGKLPSSTQRNVTKHLRKLQFRHRLVEVTGNLMRRLLRSCEPRNASAQAVQCCRIQSGER